MKTLKIITVAILFSNSIAFAVEAPPPKPPRIVCFVDNGIKTCYIRKINGERIIISREPVEQ